MEMAKSPLHMYLSRGYAQSSISLSLYQKYIHYTFRYSQITNNVQCMSCGELFCKKKCSLSEEEKVMYPIT